ncbi:hypothetical protein L6452_15480 [Arctium lappa]|uniref:Uncharacterized protein n=1 Tax=Arctium lappa TaxID=4217 RepID=A0ACB9CNP7_ARCLA|nr:hypothetical protein L6452_15480 [Arctium lappa]
MAHMWSIREGNLDVNPYEVYEHYPRLILVKIHHGGIFTRSPGRKYIIGKVSYVDLINVDELSVHEIDLMMVKLGYDLEERMYYNFCIPEHDLDFGLEPLGNDLDILNLIGYTKKWKIIDIYIEHGRTTVRTYERSLSKRKVVIEEIIDDNSPEMNRTRARANEPENVTLEEVNAEGDNQSLEFDLNQGLGETRGMDFDLNVLNEAEDVEHGNPEAMDCEVNVQGGDHHEEVENIEGMEIDLSDLDDVVHEEQGIAEGMNFDLHEQDGYDIDNMDDLHDVLGDDYTDYIHFDEPLHEQEQFNQPEQLHEQLYRAKAQEEAEKAKAHEKDDGEDDNEVFEDISMDMEEFESGEDSEFESGRQKALHRLKKAHQETIGPNPDVPLRALAEGLTKKYELRVTKMKAYRAKTIATKRLRGDYCEQYEHLRDYVLELKRANLGTTVKIAVEDEANPDSPTRQFKHIYICIGALKDGFRACRKDLLGLDGTFMEGPFPGQILTAVGVDPNQGIYPLAYAIVEAETTYSWTCVTP